MGLVLANQVPMPPEQSTIPDSLHTVSPDSMSSTRSHLSDSQLPHRYSALGGLGVSLALSRLAALRPCLPFGLRGIMTELFRTIEKEGSRTRLTAANRFGTPMRIVLPSRQRKA